MAKTMCIYFTFF